MYCIKCGKELVEGALFCAFCGTKQVQKMTCGKCGASIPEGGTFCPMCGTPAGQETQKPDAPKTRKPKAADVSENDFAPSDNVSVNNNTYARKDICTSKESFYLNGYGLLSLNHIYDLLFFDYKDTIYYLDSFAHSIYKFVLPKSDAEKKKNDFNLMLEIEENDYSFGDDYGILGVNAYGIFVLGTSEEKNSLTDDVWYRRSLRWYTLDGELKSENKLEKLQEEYCLDKFSLCGKDLYFCSEHMESKNDHIDKGDIYHLDMETNKLTKILNYFSDFNSCEPSNDIIDVRNIIADTDGAVLQLTTEFSKDEICVTDTNWYYYNAAAKTLSCIDTKYAPHMLTKHPEYFDPDSSSYVPPEKRGKNYIVTIDIADRAFWILKKKDQDHNVLVKCPLPGNNNKYNEQWVLPDNQNCPFKIDESGCVVANRTEGARFFFDGKTMIYGDGEKEMTFLSKNGIPYKLKMSVDGRLYSGFEVFDNAIFFPSDRFAGRHTGDMQSPAIIPRNVAQRGINKDNIKDEALWIGTHSRLAGEDELSE